MDWKNPATKRKYDQQWRLDHPEQRKESQRKWSKKRPQLRLNKKIIVLTHYSPEQELQCSWTDCHVTDIDMLTLDHINNDGKKDRRKGLSGTSLYDYLMRNGFPEGFQTLCANHQMKKELMRKRNKSGNGEQNGNQE